MATVRIQIWYPASRFTIAAPSEREAARMAETMLRDLEAARRGTVAFWVETQNADEKERLLAYLRDLAREIEAESRLIMLSPLDLDEERRSSGE
jgi:hypothetical protein